MEVLDLFCGMGGLSLGFKKHGFEVRGVDADQHCVETYRCNVGPAEPEDLSAEDQLPSGPADILLAGPPCRPWSRLNLQRSRMEHPDRPLVGSFTRALLSLEPRHFILENVPLLERDTLFEELVQTATAKGYECEWRPVRYSNFGAATSRRRLILFGSRGISASAFWERLMGLATTEMTVGEALRPYWNLHEEEIPDHQWPKLNTIGKYTKKYEEEKFGWYRLKEDRPAPSFGNINKTYTLHPASFDGAGPRVLSVREAMALMGFDDEFAFPEGVPITAKYRMVADTVSPKFSARCAEVLKGLVA